MLRLLERRLTFKPNKIDHGALTDRTYEPFHFGSDRGLFLNGGLVRGTSKEIVLFCHGNRHNITRFKEQYQLFDSLGLSYFFFDYPGYGESTGIPSEDVLYESAFAAYDLLTQQLGYQADDITVYGCSLGGAVSIELVSQHAAKQLITESIFTCSWDMARHLYPYLPIWWLYPNRFRNDQKIAHLKLPILMIHGDADRTTPCAMGESLFRVAPSALELLIVRGANHINPIEKGGEALRSRVKAFLTGEITSRRDTPRYL